MCVSVESCHVSLRLCYECLSLIGHVVALVTSAESCIPLSSLVTEVRSKLRVALVMIAEWRDCPHFILSLSHVLIVACFSSGSVHDAIVSSCLPQWGSVRESTPREQSPARRRKKPKRAKSTKAAAGNEDVSTISSRAGASSGAGNASSSASATLTHCKACNGNNRDKRFAQTEGLEMAELFQCCDCYYIWLPMSRFLSWLAFCDLCKSDDDFNKKTEVARLRQFPSRPAPPHSFQPEGVANNIQFGVKCFRRGVLKQKGQLVFDGKNVRRSSCASLRHASTRSLANTRASSWPTITTMTCMSRCLP